MDLVTRLGLGRALRISAVPHASPAASDLEQDFTVLEPSDASEADVLLLDIEGLESADAVKALQLMGDYSVALIPDAGVGIDRIAGLPQRLAELGFVKSWIPLDGCALMVSRRGFGKGFFKLTLEAYRESFIYGPNPIHYNTAYTLYMLARFTLSRLDGKLVEVGTGRGFSTLWLARAAQDVGCEVLSVDVNCERMESAFRFLSRAGVSNAVLACVEGVEAPQVVGGSVSMLFIDALKSEYHNYLASFEHLLRKGSVVTAHNTLSSSLEVREYLRIVYGPNYRSVTIPTDPAGLTISARS